MDRSTAGRIGAHTSWARTSDRSARTAAARAAADARFLDEVDPERKLPEDERIRRADHARKAFYIRLQAKSVAARRRRGRP